MFPPLLEWMRMTLVVTKQIMKADSERSLVPRLTTRFTDEAAVITQNLPVTDILVLNFMPKKDPAIVDLSLALGGTKDFNVRPVFLNVPIETARDENGQSVCHIDFPVDEYCALLEAHNFKGVIFNGASADEVPFENTSGLEQVKAAMDLAREKTGGVFNICWSAMAGLYVDHGVNKGVSNKKIIGQFDQVPTPKGCASPLMKAWGDATPIPCGRLGYVPDASILAVPALDVLASTPQMAQNYDLGSSIAFVEDKQNRTFYMLNHPEYGPDAIRKEYERDVASGGQGGIETPEPTGDYKIPKGQDAPWKQAAHNLFNAWLHTLESASCRISNDNDFASCEDLNAAIQVRP